jgi:hypothetical protein
MDLKYDKVISDLKACIMSAKADDDKQVFSLCGKLLKLIHSRQVSDGVLVATSNIEVFDDLLSGKLSITLSKARQLVIVELYKALLLPSPTTKGAPGYVVRSVITNALTTLTNSKASAQAKEVTVTVIGEILRYKSMDCGSMLSDIIAAVMKMVRASDSVQRCLALRAATKIVVGCTNRIGDTHAEILRFVTKIISDKNPDVRVEIASLVQAIASNSAGCTTVSTETMLAACIKGLEDDIGAVQDAFATTVARIFHEQILAYRAIQNLERAGKNRGGANEDGDAQATVAGKPNAKAQTRMERLGLSGMMGSAKKITEEYDFKSVIQGILRCIIKSQTSNGNLRAGYMASLAYLLRSCMRESDENGEALPPEDFEWLIPQLLGLVHNTEELGLGSYEEIAVFRMRLSYLFRFAMTANSTESGQKALASALLEFVKGTVDVSRSEAEVQIALTELAHIIAVMGDTASSIQDETHIAVGMFLKDNSFGVRSAAANVLTALASVIPYLASSILSKALAIAKVQVDELVFGDGDTEIPQAEKMQRMFTFHGQALLISNFLKSEEQFPSGLPSHLILSVFDFGLDLLSVDVLSAPMNTRNITCSLVRAGSLIVSSCLSKGYKVVKTKMADLVDIYDLIFKSITAVHTNTGSSDGLSNNPFDSQDSSTGQSTQPGGGRQDEILYEMMYMEAALVCLSSLLWSCPEALLYEDNCLALVTNGLESAYRIAKAKYQPKFRTHFRFRTLHAILLECFSWLPPGSFPMVSQPVYVEALRVLRDCMASGSESRLLGQFSGSTETQHILGLSNNNQSILTLAANSASMSSYMMGSSSTKNKGATTASTSSTLNMNYLPTYPNSEMILMLKLEQYSHVLSKKENEASLAVFSRDVCEPSQDIIYGVTNSIYKSRMDWQKPVAPCVHVDSRLIDAAITLLAATFPHQSTELQERAIQLCAQAVDQFVKQVSTGTLSMFSSEEDKKKRDIKAFVTVKTVACSLCSIIKAFPVHHGMTLELDLPWGHSVISMLTDMLKHYNSEVQYAAAQGLATFSSKITGSHIAESMCSSLSQTLSLSLSKDSKTDNMES